MMNFFVKNRAKSQPPLSSDELNEVIAQYHHRILSLEAELKEQGRAQTMSGLAFSKRVKDLKSLHESLRELHQFSLAGETDTAQGRDLGLPPLRDGSPDEHLFCQEYLEKRIRQSEALKDSLAKVGSWLAQVTLGQMGGLEIILRLSELRRLVARTHKELDTLTHDVNQKKSMASGILKSLGKPSELGDIDRLAEVFHEADGIIARVAKLRAGVKKETARTSAMSQWLQKEEARLRARRPDMAPPSPLTLGKVAHDLKKQPKRRDELIQQYWDEVVFETQGKIPKERVGKAELIMSERRLTLPRSGG